MKRRSSPRVRLLLDLLDEAFDRKAWHGVNLRGSVRGVDAAFASWRPREGRHNVWEIVVHAAYWKYAVRRRLTGEKRGSFALQGSNWFERPQGDASEAAWRADVRLLAREHQLLRAVIEKMKDADIDRRVGGRRWTRRALVSGVAAHDVYHAGQVQSLKKLRTGRRRR